jgi:hypothetical protein
MPSNHVIILSHINYLMQNIYLAEIEGAIFERAGSQPGFRV